MKIYIVYTTMDYEGGVIRGIYTELDKAQDMRDIWAQYDGSYSTTKIEEAELDAEMNFYP